MYFSLFLGDIFCQVKTVMSFCSNHMLVAFKRSSDKSKTCN